MSDAINALLFRNWINVVVTQDHESQIMRPITLAIVWLQMLLAIKKLCLCLRESDLNILMLPLIASAVTLIWTF